MGITVMSRRECALCQFPISFRLRRHSPVTVQILPVCAGETFCVAQCPFLGVLGIGPFRKKRTQSCCLVFAYLTQEMPGGCARRLHTSVRSVWQEKSIQLYRALTGDRNCRCCNKESIVQNWQKNKTFKKLYIFFSH